MIDLTFKRSWRATNRQFWTVFGAAQWNKREFVYRCGTTDEMVPSFYSEVKWTYIRVDCTRWTESKAAKKLHDFHRLFRRGENHLQQLLYSVIDGFVFCNGWRNTNYIQYKVYDKKYNNAEGNVKKLPDLKKMKMVFHRDNA